MPALPWASDVHLPAAAAARLLEQQFPELSPVSLQILGEGWDYWAFLVNARLVFRFPRRRVAADLVEREWLILPTLAPHLPLAVPLPSHLGRPGAGYPYPFLGYEFIPGQNACRVEWSDRSREAAGGVLGAFLRRLHNLKVDENALAWAPGDELGRTDPDRRLLLALERLDRLAGTMAARDAARARKLLHELSAAPPYSGSPRWVHGDLYACQILVNEELLPTGVLDWVDAHLGDPALDLMLLFGFLPPAARNSFREAYGPVDDATGARARFRAVQYGLTLLEYGRAQGDEGIRRAGEYGLWASLQ